MKRLGAGEAYRASATSAGVTERTEETRLMCIQALVVEILNRLLCAPITRTDEEIQYSIAQLGQFCGSDRTYVFLERDGLLHNTHEWCADGIDPMIDELQQLPMDLIANWQDEFHKGHAIHIPDVDHEPKVELRKILTSQGIRSLLVVPMAHNGELFGFMGFDAVRSHKRFLSGEVYLLKSVADGITTIILRRRHQRKIEQVQAELNKERGFLEGILSTSVSGIAVLDEHGRFIFLNEAAENILGVCQDELNGQPHDTPRLKSTRPDNSPIRPEDSPFNLVHALHQPVENIRWRLEGKDGVRYVSINAAPQRQGEVERVVYGINDVTRQVKAEQALQIAATRDDLTGLFNRSVIWSELDRHLTDNQEHSASLALLFLDIDGFKRVNDTLGHYSGDALLALIAKRISRVLSDNHTVARMGGDEFMVICAGNTAEDAVRLAQRLLDAFFLPFELHGGPVSVTVSIGVVVAPQDGADPETLIRNADIALYRSKAEGRNMLTRFEPRMRDDVVRRTNIEQGLQRSLLEKNDDLWLVYQPQITCDAARRVVGAEALLRWTGSEIGPVGPADFIAIAEATGLIRPLDHRVIALAAEQIAIWAKAGIVVPISVNVSAVSMQTEDFANEVIRCLDECETPRSLFRIEIVETVYLEATSTTLENLDIFWRAGIEISIDDFGTGHSSLSYLRRLPVRYLKMDRSFVERIGIGTQHDDALAEAILAMARALRIDVIAEGVETDAQFEWLSRKGCAQVQGFLTGKPLEPEVLAKYYLR